MCNVQQIPRRIYYYEAKIRDNQDEALTNLIIVFFTSSRDIYCQKNKKELEKIEIFKYYFFIIVRLDSIMLSRDRLDFVDCWSSHNQTRRLFLIVVLIIFNM